MRPIVVCPPVLSLVLLAIGRPKRLASRLPLGHGPCLARHYCALFLDRRTYCQLTDFFQEIKRNKCCREELTSRCPAGSATGGGRGTAGIPCSGNRSLAVSEKLNQCFRRSRKMKFSDTDKEWRRGERGKGEELPWPQCHWRRHGCPCSCLGSHSCPAHRLRCPRGGAETHSSGRLAHRCGRLSCRRRGGRALSHAASHPHRLARQSGQT